MTRFEREINGSLGAFWKKNAEGEVRNAVATVDSNATVETDGAIKGNSSGRYLMDDFCYYCDVTIHYSVKKGVTMQNYATIIGVIELRLNDISYENQQEEICEEKQRSVSTDTEHENNTCKSHDKEAE